MVFTEMTVTESRVNFLLFVFLIAILMATIGLSGIVNFRMRQARHHAPPRYRGRRRAQPVAVAFVLLLVRRYENRAGQRSKAGTAGQEQSTPDDLDRVKVTA